MALVADVEAIVLRALGRPDDFDCSAETVVVLIDDEEAGGHRRGGRAGTVVASSC